MVMLFIYLPEVIMFAVMVEFNDAVSLKQIAKMHVSSHRF
jgi:hypothetical protein